MRDSKSTTTKQRHGKKRVTIQSLPLEIIMLICTFVDCQACRHDHRDVEINPNDPAQLMQLLFQGFMGAVGIRPAGGVAIPVVVPVPAPAQATPTTVPEAEDLDSLEDPGDPEEEDLSEGITAVPSAFNNVFTNETANVEPESQASGEIIGISETIQGENNGAVVAEEAEDLDSEEDSDVDEGITSDEEGDREETFPDGLPVHPLVPLALVSRPFLHATRKTIYHRCSIVSTFQASLLLRSLSKVQSVGSKFDEPNVLASLVRSLCFRQNGEISLGRGGAEIYIDILKLCQNLEELVMVPQFLRSATVPFLGALKTLKKLKAVELSSGRDPTHPFIMTTPRLVELLEDHWMDLEDLTVNQLKGGEAGPDEELDLMWYREYDEDEDEDDDDEDEDEDEDEDYESCDEEEGGEYGKNHTSSSETAEKESESGQETEEELQEKKKPVGLKRLTLIDVDVPHDELELVLKHSKSTLETFSIRPTEELSRYGMATLLLTYGVNLRSLKIEAGANWYPIPKPLTRVQVPIKPKNYIPGEPTESTICKIEEHPYLLDAILPYLPNLSTLQFDGNLASTAVFSTMSKSLNTLSWSNARNISPLLLAKLLKKNIPKTVSFKRADGTFGTKSVNTKVAAGLKCITVDHDDLHWKPEDLIELCKVASERGICLHLSNGMEELAMGMEDVPGGAVGVGGVLPAEIPADLAGLLNAVNGGGGGLRLGPIGINGGVGVQITAINGVQVGLQVPAPAQPPIPAPVPVVPAVPTAAGIPVDEDDDERRRETLDRPVVFGNDSVFDLD